MFSVEDMLHHRPLLENFTVIPHYFILKIYKCHRVARKQVGVHADDQLEPGEDQYYPRRNKKHNQLYTVATSDMLFHWNAQWPHHVFFLMLQPSFIEKYLDNGMLPLFKARHTPTNFAQPSRLTR